MSSSEYYNENRRRVFEIYGLDPKDSRYNCHHIVSKKDYKNGVVGPEFDLDGKANLYPLRKNLHNILTDIIDAAERGDDTQNLYRKMRLVEANNALEETRNKQKENKILHKII